MRKNFLLFSIILLILSCKKNYNCTCSTSTLQISVNGYINNGVFVTTSTNTETVVTKSITTINHSTRDNAIEKCDSSTSTTTQYTTTCVLN